MAKSNQRRSFDYTTSLLTGKFEKVKSLIDGRTREEFVPSIANKYPTLMALARDNPQFNKQEILVRQELVLRPLIIDRTEFTKAKEEKITLKHAKKEHKRIIIEAGFDPNKRLNLEPSLVIPSIEALRDVFKNYKKN